MAATTVPAVAVAVDSAGALVADSVLDNSAGADAEPTLADVVPSLEDE